MFLKDIFTYIIDFNTRLYRNKHTNSIKNQFMCKCIVQLYRGVIRARLAHLSLRYRPDLHSQPDFIVIRTADFWPGDCWSTGNDRRLCHDRRLWYNYHDYWIGVIARPANATETTARFYCFRDELFKPL